MSNYRTNDEFGHDKAVNCHKIYFETLPKKDSIERRLGLLCRVIKKESYLNASFFSLLINIRHVFVSKKR